MTGIQGSVLDEADIRSQVRILEDELKRHKVSGFFINVSFFSLFIYLTHGLSTAPAERGTSAL